MLTINQLEREIRLLEDELKVCMVKDNYTDIARILTGISTLKDTLLESYRKSYTKNIVGSICNTNIDIVKQGSTDISAPLRIIK